MGAGSALRLSEDIQLPIERLMACMSICYDDAVAANQRLARSREELAAAKDLIEIQAKKLRLRARLSEARYSRLLQCAPDGIAVVDGGGRMLAVNPALEALFSRPGRPLVGSGFASWFDPDTGAKIQSWLRHIHGRGHGRLENIRLSARGAPPGGWSSRAPMWTGRMRASC